MKELSLNGTWHACGISPEGQRLYFKGEVPGCVHTDLLREGQIRAPFYQKQSQECQWIERWSWYYERAFVVDRVEAGMYFRFDGLDTICEIYLNGKRIGSADNMFLSHTFPAKGLKVGENTLRVVFTSPVSYMAGRPKLNAAFTCERLYTRRMQCTYFWDWVDRFVTFGIYRDCALIIPETAEIESVYLYTKSVDAYSAQIGLQLRTTLHGEGAYVKYQILSPDGKTVFEKTRWVEESFVFEKIDIINPILWYPNGYGDPSLYEATVTLYADEACTSKLDEKRYAFGIRTVKILELPDEAGSREETLCRQLKEASRFAGDGARFDQNERFSGFVLLVNGIRIFCKGGNWVPCEPFPSAERDDKITSILELAQKANMNMVRVWGGGLFEKDQFYNECDRLGLLVTQDFMMACGDYPEDDDRFCDEIRKEAEQAVVRLRNHPSLVWWTGDNENGTFAYEDRKGYVSRKVSMSILAPVVMALDPYRDFLLSSPYGGVPFGSVTKGTTHNTNYMVPMFGTFESSDLSDYRGVLEGFLCRFCAEHPTMGMPTLFGMKRFLGTENIFEEDDDILRFHTKNNPGFVGNELFDYINLFAEKILGNYVNPLDRRLKQQYIQYEWIRITGEYFRRHAWFTSGLIYWMLNDCWPAAGWSLIDYYNIPKLGYYAATKTNRSVMVSIAEDGEDYVVYLCNDSSCDKTVSLCLRAYRISNGNECGRWEKMMTAEKESVLTAFCVPKAELSSLGPAELLLVCDFAGDTIADRAHFFPLRPKDMVLPSPKLRMMRNENGTVTLTADTVVLGVLLDGNAVFEDNGFLMLPGETRSIAYTKIFEKEAEELSVYSLFQEEA